MHIYMHTRKNKKPLTAAFSLSCLKIRSRNEEAINCKRNETDLLAKCFLLLILSTSILFTCFWIDLVRLLATTGNTSAVAGYTRVISTRKFKGSIPNKLHHCQISKKWCTCHIFSVIAENKSHAPTTHLHTVKVYNWPDHRNFINSDSYFFIDHSVVFTCSKAIIAFKW